jgi:hypothetical protein
MVKEANEFSKGSEWWSKLSHYREKAGNGIFEVMEESIYSSGDVKISVQKMEGEEWNTFCIMPMGLKDARDRLAYEVFVSIWEEKDIWWWLTFALVNVKREWDEQFHLEIFEDLIILPEAYRWWDVALDIYKSTIDFAKRMWVKRINSDVDQSKWAVRVYEKLKSLWYNVIQNTSSIWTKSQNFVPTNKYPNFTIEL